MSSRKEQKERARQVRLARERDVKARAKRKRLLTWAGSGLVVFAVAAVVVVTAASSGGNAPGAGATAGLQVSAAPWSPEYGQLATRLQALNLPAQGNAYHVHAELRVYVDGVQVPVAADVGIDPQGQFLAPLHTHDTSGTIHIEAAQQYPFTIRQFFTIWGVKLTATRLGGYVSGKGAVLAAYVNGRRIPDPPRYVMHAHDLIVVGYGKPGSFPRSYQFAFSAGE